MTTRLARSTRSSHSVSRYPSSLGTPITTRFYLNSVNAVGGDALSGSWTLGKITGYRDWAGSEAEVSEIMMIDGDNRPTRFLRHARLFALCINPYSVHLRSSHH
ncbi:hypothetical protein FRB93_001954 [Tulasnella sp. JGI-2019a]|nr:hypothetical protein FRB93_001954 [Tulasnella sp. JGI-2019a]